MAKITKEDGMEAARLIHPDWLEEKIRNLVDKAWEAYLRETAGKAAEKSSEEKS